MSKQRKFAIFTLVFVAMSYCIAFHCERDKRKELEKRLEKYEKTH